jgi:hypothetical protein
MIDVAELVGAVLRQVARQARWHFNGAEPTRLVLTHPARWGTRALNVLERAAALSGLPNPQFVPEPAAAALHYGGAPSGHTGRVAVYDLGAGTFDAAVLNARSTDSLPELAGPPGGDEDVGGELFDSLLLKYLRDSLGTEEQQVWDAGFALDSRRGRRDHAYFAKHLRDAREHLSAYTRASLYLPPLDRDTEIRRDLLNQLIQEPIARSISILAITIDAAGGQDHLEAIYLSGGASRTPLVSEMLRERFDAALVSRGDPKSAVPLGAASLHYRPESASGEHGQGNAEPRGRKVSSADSANQSQSSARDHPAKPTAESAAQSTFGVSGPNRRPAASTTGPPRSNDRTVSGPSSHIPPRLPASKSRSKTSIGVIVLLALAAIGLPFLVTALNENSTSVSPSFEPPDPSPEPPDPSPEPPDEVTVTIWNELTSGAEYEIVAIYFGKGATTQRLETDVTTPRDYIIYEDVAPGRYHYRLYSETTISRGQWYSAAGQGWTTIDSATDLAVYYVRDPFPVDNRSHLPGILTLRPYAR